MRWVLDTNVVASAMLWGGSPLRLLQAARDRRVDLFTSTPLLAELTDILGRSKFERKIAAAQLSIDQLLDRYVVLAALVRPVSIPRIAPDPDDDIVIGTALAASAETIVTGDRTLLGIGRYRGTMLVSVRDAMTLLKQHEQPQL